MRFLKQIPTKVAVVLLLLLFAAIVYGGWHVNQHNLSESPQRGGLGTREVDPRDDDDDEFETELMESFANELGQANDLGRDERDATYRMLKEADVIWRRVKLENSEALRRANLRPRIVPPKASDPFVSDPIE